jgi:hypothetical protein
LPFFSFALRAACENIFHNRSISDIRCKTILSGNFGPALLEGPPERRTRGGTAEYEEQKHQVDEDNEGEEDKNEMSTWKQMNKTGDDKDPEEDGDYNNVAGERHDDDKEDTPSIQH